MQKLEERNTYTPTDIPHVRSNCDPVLNVPERVSVLDLKTSSNNSDAALTGQKSTRTGLASFCQKTFPLFDYEYDCRFVNPAYINPRGQIPPVAEANGFPLTP